MMGKNRRIRDNHAYFVMSNDRIPIDIQANVHPVYPPSFPPKNLHADMNVLPILDKRLVTDNSFWKTPLQAELEINTANFQRQINATMKQLRAAEAAIDLQFNVKPGDIQSLVSRIQAEFKKNHNISLFNKDSRISPEHVRLYLDKFFKEVRTVINANTDKFSIEFQSDFTKIEEQFLRFKAKLNLDLPVTEVDFSTLESSFTKVVESLRTEISNTLPDALDTFFTKFETETRKITDSFNDAINDIRKNITDTGTEAFNAAGKIPAKVEPPANMPPIEIPVTPKIQIPEDAVTQLQKAFNDFFLKLVSVPVGFKISDETTHDIQSWVNTIQVDLEHLKIADPTDFLQTLEDIFDKTTALSTSLKNGVNTSAQTKQMKDAFDSILSVVNSITAAIASWANITPPQAPMPPPADPTASPAAPPPTQPNITVDTSNLAAVLAANPLDVNVIRFLTKSSVGLGWDAKGGGGAGSGKGAYQDLTDYLKTFLLQGNVTSRLQTLTGAMQSQADTAAGGTSNFARFSQQYGGSNQMSSKVIEDAFKALQSEDLSVLDKRGGTTSAEETQALANIDKTLERIMKINSVTDASGTVASDRTSLGDTIKQLLERATTDSSAGASSMNNLTEIIKSLSTSQAKVDQLNAQAGSLNADDSELVKVLQSIESLSSALTAQHAAVRNAGFSGIAEVQDQASYRERRVTQESERLGRDLTGAEIQGIDDEWLQKINTLPQVLQAGAAQMETLGKTADKVMEDLNDPNRWQGITGTLTTALGKAQQAANGFADTLSRMGLTEASQGLQDVTQQIGGFVQTMQQMQGVARQIQTRTHGLSSQYQAQAVQSQAAADRHRTHESTYTQRASRAQEQAAHARAAGNTTRANRWDAVAARNTSRAAVSGRAATAAANTAGRLGMFAKSITLLGNVAGKAVPVVGALASVLTVAISIMNSMREARLKAIQAERARAQEASDVRMLTRTNTASLATASARQVAQTNTQEWQRTSAVYQMRHKMLGMELDATEQLISLEVERMKAADRVSDAMQQFQNNIVESEKEIENAFKDRERAGTWDVQQGWFYSSASNANGDYQGSGGNFGEAIGAAITAGLAGAGIGAATGLATSAGVLSVPGAIIGGAIGAGGSLLGSLLGWGSGKLTGGNDDVLRYTDRGWGTSQDEEIEASINARNQRTNQEIAAAAKAEFEVLNAPIQQLATQFETFGKFLPSEDVEAFTQTINAATEANQRLAVSRAEIQHARDIIGKSSSALEAENADKVSGWLWDDIAGYSAQVGNQTIVADTQKQLQEKVQEALGALEESYELDEQIAKVRSGIAKSELTRLAERGKLEQAIADAQIRSTQAVINAMQKVRENVVNIEQGLEATLNNIGEAQIGMEFEQRREARSAEIAKVELAERDAAGIDDRHKALNREREYGNMTDEQISTLGDLREKDMKGQLDANAKGISAEEKTQRAAGKAMLDFLAATQKTEKLTDDQYQQRVAPINADEEESKRNARHKTLNYRLEDVQDEFDTNAQTMRRKAFNRGVAAPTQFRMDEYEARMRAEINIHQKALDLENSLHQTRLTNIENYATARNQAAQKYLSTSLKTFSSGRGANPLEEAKKLTIASMEQDEEERRAKIRMKQEMAAAELRTKQEMAIAQKRMDMDAKNRELEMKFQVDLMQWKTEHEIALAEKVRQYQMQYEKEYDAWEQRTGNLTDDEKKKEENKFKTPEMDTSDLKNMQFDGGAHFDKMQSAQQSLNQEMANIQRNQANEMHGLNMRNIDEEHKHSLEYTIEWAKKERELNKEIYLDKFRAQQVELQTSAESAQRQTDMSFATSVFGAKSGEDRMKAVVQYQTDSQYNTRRAQLEQKHAEETERMEQQGATEEQRARLKQQQGREMGGLDQEKAFKEAIISALGGTGTLRDLVKEDGAVGSKTGLSETHERLKSSAFGHIQDPAADAVKRMAKEQSLQHAQYMQFWAQNVPRMLTALQGQGLAGQMSTINNFSMGLSGEPL